jgi:tetratricopeptide (TPR) repeat protein
MAVTAEEMRGTSMKKLKVFSLLAAVLLLPASLFGQATGTIHGHVNNAAGLPITSGQVKLTLDKTAEQKDMKFKNTFDIDANGDFKGAGVVAGDYLAVVVVGTANVDYQEVIFKPGDDKLVNFDMTRKEYMDKMSDADKKALEEYKKTASAAINTNKVIANLNNAMKQVQADLASATPNYAEDVKTMQQATTQKADEPVLWFNLGAALVAQADSAAKAAKKAGTSWQSDGTTLQEYNDAIAAYKKGIELNAASKKPNPVDAASSWNSIGNTEAKLGKLPESQEAFDNAVKLNPASAGMVYGNQAAVLFNAGQGDAAALAADKAIAADPTRPDPYYIKAQALIAKATVDKAGKIVAPPGCVDAYQKYLELAPNGPHAQDAKEILGSMGETVTTKYKAPGKKG